MKDSSAGKYYSLQLLRGIACTYVLVHHAMMHIATHRIDPRVPVWLGGLSGVDIFFVLSGFVMLYSSQKLAGEPRGWRTFARHRLLRIVPMYWLVTLLFLVPAWRLEHVALTARNLWWVVGSFLMVPVREPGGMIFPVLAIGWTLVFEMFFYAVFTLGLFLRMKVLRFVGVVMAVATILSLFRRPTWPAALFFYLDPLVMEFFAGMVIAWLAIRRKLLPQPLAWLAMLGGLGYLIWFPVYAPEWRAVELGIPAVLSVYGAASLEPKFRKLPAALLLFADASYVLYLIHLPIVQALIALCVKANVHQGWVVLALCLVVPVLVACAMRRWIEEPLTRAMRERVLLRSQNSIEASAAP